jgi:hypothetical protein
VIYYPNNNGINAVGFMMSHKQLLLKNGIVSFDKANVGDELIEDGARDLFMDYKYDEVYQVKVEFIQQETGLQFMLQNVNLPYQLSEKKDVLYKRIEVLRHRTIGAPTLIKQDLDFTLDRITL